MTAPMLEVEHLTVDFDRPDGSRMHAVRDVSFALEPGDRLGLVGESGCGKSTALLALMGLLPPTAEVGGTILLDGVDILRGGDRSMRPHRWRDVAMVFQGAMNAFDPLRRVGDQIAEPILLHERVRRDVARKRAVDLLELVGIAGDRATRYPHEFSGGMRQRAALAMALACDPRILLADEPTTALDTIVQAEVLALLRRVTEERGVAMVFVSHDLPAVAQVSQRIAVMYGGTVVESAPAADLLRAPRHPYSAALLTAIPDPWSDVPTVPILGDAGRSGLPSTGCPFAPRCPLADERCRRETPALRMIGTGLVACHRAEQTA